MRPDVPSLLPMLLALYFALQIEEWGYAACVLSGLAVGVGFLVKQSAGAAGLAIVLVLLSNRRVLRAVIVTISAAVPLALALFLLLSHHEQFLEHFLSAGRSTWSIGGAASWLAEPHLMRPSALMLFAIATAGIARALSSGEKAQMIASFALVNLAAGFATIPQLGGQTNYFIPGFAGCALLLPYAIQTFQENRKAIELAGIIAVIGFVAAFADCAGAFHMLPSVYSPKTIPPGYLSSLKIFSEDDYLLVHTRDPELLDPFTTHSLELKGRWSPSGVVKDIESAQFDLAILTGGRMIRTYRGISDFGPAIVKALNENYDIAYECGEVLVLKPRSREVAVTPQMLSRVLGNCVESPPQPDLKIPFFAR